MSAMLDDVQKLLLQIIFNHRQPLQQLSLTANHHTIFCPKWRQLVRVENQQSYFHDPFDKELELEGAFCRTPLTCLHRRAGPGPEQRQRGAKRTPGSMMTTITACIHSGDRGSSICWLGQIWLRDKTRFYIIFLLSARRQASCQDCKQQGYSPVSS